MAKGRVNFILSVEVDTGDDTPMDAVLEELAGSHALISKEVLMIETPIAVFNPQIEEVEEYYNDEEG